MDKFNCFIYLEEVDYDDAKMILFAQILSGEAKRWFKDILAISIVNFEYFKTLLWIGGNIKIC